MTSENTFDPTTGETPEPGIAPLPEEEPLEDPEILKEDYIEPPPPEPIICLSCGKEIVPANGEGVIYRRMPDESLEGPFCNRCYPKETVQKGVMEKCQLLIKQLQMRRG